jgi:hypothetical protein
MKQLIALVVGLLSAVASAQQYVEGYCRGDGRCVQGYFKTRPNDTAADNYGSAGNLNPNTGRTSSRELEIPNTGRADSGNVYQVGPRGGQYYISESGRKVYRRRD